MSTLLTLLEEGQSVWLDYIDRDLVLNGGLRDMVANGVRGVTSNPTIFQKAIVETDFYNDAIIDLIQADHEIDAAGLYHWLTLQDIQAAADELRDVFESSEGHDGYVSLEVSPHLAHDAQATIISAKHLWNEVKRPNLMIKVPGTESGVAAFEALIADGINVNVTLLFSLSRYIDVAQAYMRGLERNPEPENVASVASFFVSRVDSKVDAALEKTGTEEALSLRGKIANANARSAYHTFLELNKTAPFMKQYDRGARKQRLLWASTGVKNPAYSDLLYVEELIGPDTVNTLPLKTLEAFLHHGEVRPSLGNELDYSAAQSDMKQLRNLGIHLDEICDQLEKEGVKSFVDSYDQLLNVLAEKCSSVARDFASA